MNVTEPFHFHEPTREQNTPDNLGTKNQGYYRLFQALRDYAEIPKNFYYLFSREVNRIGQVNADDLGSQIVVVCLATRKAKGEATLKAEDLSRILSAVSKKISREAAKWRAFDRSWDIADPKLNVTSQVELRDLLEKISAIALNWSTDAQSVFVLLAEGEREIDIAKKLKISYDSVRQIICRFRQDLAEVFQLSW